jgi:purine-cytosine permease-like protein
MIQIATFIVLWLVSALVGYLITRRGYRSNKYTWDHSNALWMALCCLVGGPFVMVEATCTFCRPKSVSEWLDKKSEW